MEKAGTINVIGRDKALETSRAIIKTHEYCLLNFDLMNDRERGYMFNEYFPTVKDYLVIEPEVFIPMKPDEPPKEDFKTFTGKSVGDNYPQPPQPNTDADLFTEEFRYKIDVQLLGFKLGFIPSSIKGVWVASCYAEFNKKKRFQLIPNDDFTYNLTTGYVDFPTLFMPKGDKWKLQDIFRAIMAARYFSIFVEYTKAPCKAYEVGTDGEN